MAIKVRQGKGNKDRYTLLSEKLLLKLRDYYKISSSNFWNKTGKWEKMTSTIIPNKINQNGSPEFQRIHNPGLEHNTFGGVPSSWIDQNNYNVYYSVSKDDSELYQTIKPEKNYHAEWTYDVYKLPLIKNNVYSNKVISKTFYEEENINDKKVFIFSINGEKLKTLNTMEDARYYINNILPINIYIIQTVKTNGEIIIKKQINNKFNIRYK